MNLITRTFRRFSTACILSVLAGGLVYQANSQVVTGVQPTTGSVDVPLNASIVFNFDVPIEPTTLNQTAVGGIFAGSLHWSANVDPTQMIDTWSAANTVLTLNYVGDLPGSSTITWEINPVGGFLKLSDEETFFPVANASGSFTTVEGSNCNPDGVPDSFGRYFLSKNLIYLQSGPSTPVIDAEVPAIFFANVESPDINAVLGASLKLPNGSSTSLLFFGNKYIIGGSFDSEAEMDAAYPAGNYEMTMTRSIPPATFVSMDVPAAYPPTPMVTNFQQAQAVNPAINFTLRWEAFSGAADSDRIVLTIEDGDTTIFAAPDLCVPVELLNTAISVIIPAGTLGEGKIYGGTLSFYKDFYFSTNSPAEFLTAGSMVKSTQFTINTGGTIVVPQPQLSGSAFNLSGQFEFTANNMLIGAGYRLEYSTTLLLNSWTLLELFTPTATSWPVIDNSSSDTTGRRFYRVITQ